MKKLIILFAVACLMAITVVPAMAGPSRAIIQEMGSTIAKDEVNIDLDWSGQNLPVTGTGAQVGNNTNLSVGGIALSSVNVGLADGLELRLGRTPGLRNYLGLPVDDSNLPLGVTIKGAIPGVSGLAAYLGYGSTNEKDISGNKTEASSTTLGAAYTWAGPVIVNADINYTSRAGASGAAKDTTTALAAAVLYPLKSNVIVGGELHYATIDTKDNPGGIKLTVLVPALGARVIAGNFTIDAIAVLFGTNVDTDVSGTSAATGTVIGVPTLRINYKF